MSKARREELENITIRQSYIERLQKGNHILSSNALSLAEEPESDHSAPWF